MGTIRKVAFPLPSLVDKGRKYFGLLILCFGVFFLVKEMEEK